MAQKRMFTKQIVDSDVFLDMPLSTQCLYFHLNMRADDDGFVDNTKRVMKIIGAKEDDLKLLIAKRFVLVFEDKGLIVIKHWRMHNTLSAGRYHETAYTEEKTMLKLKDNGSYTMSDTGLNIDDTRLIETSKRQTKSYKTEIREIVDYLNLVTGSKYKYSTKKTIDCITARLNEGFSVDDFKVVIDNKNEDWGKSKEMVVYLRPETLFGNKFEGYLNQQKCASDDGRQKYLDKWANA